MLSLSIRASLREVSALKDEYRDNEQQYLLFVHNYTPYCMYVLTSPIGLHP